MKKLKVGVIHIYNFPFDLAATTRITAYCKGLTALGHEIEIISIIPQNKMPNIPLSGVCDGGKYFHFAQLPNIKIWGIRSLIFRLLVFYCRKKAIHFLEKSHQQKKYDAVILSFDEPYLFDIFVPVLNNMNGVKIIAIADEYPIPIRHYLKPSIPQSKLKKYKDIYKNIDARILMTSNLQYFYDTKICPKPTLLLSTIVDTDRFINACERTCEREYLCYMGNMELSKDNVDNIIMAFKLIINKYPYIDLYLYGIPSKNNKLIIEQIIQNEGLESRVFLKGKAQYNEVPNILKSAKVLVTSQPNTKRAEGGFPTKLGEYFLTGKPSVLTDVGEISNYVKDGINAFLVNPEDPFAYAQKLEYVLDNYEMALKVADNAKKDIIDNYSCFSAGLNIARFIEGLNK